ncbi:MAG: DUF4402 domain-containing protein [Pseudomonadota bacterium]|nr:DUF4402 domain-containing protein [Pseudomonadota bacterium]
MMLVLAGAPLPAASQSISTVSAMSFGNFIAGSGGTITVSPGGARSQSGGVVLVGQGSTYSAASFRVSGTSNATYTITLPVDHTVMLADGGNTMGLNGFISIPPTGTLSGSGLQTILVGATLAVGNAQAPGNYTGTFSVTVNY